MTLFDTRMKYVLSFIKKYIWVMVGVIVLQFIQNFVFTMLPKVSTNFIFELFTPENFHQIYKYFFIALGIIIVRGVLGYVTTYSLAVYSENAVNKLRVNFFKHLINLPLHYFKKNKTGNFITITIDDISKIRTNLYEGIVNIISQSIYAIIVVTKLGLLNYKLTLISFVAFPAVYVLLRVLGKKLRRTSKKLQQNVSNLSTNLHETITGVDVVKAFAKEDSETEKFSRTSGDYRKTSLKLKVLHSAFKPLNHFIFYFFGFILIGIAGLFIVRGEWTVKGLSEYLMLLAILFTPLDNIPKAIANFKIVSASVDRVYNVVKTVNTITDPPNPVEKDIEGKIQFQNVYFAYDSETVLSGINFTVEKGDILALVGSSGAGKTSVVNLIPRFYDPVSGAVEVDGIDVKNYGIKSLRSQIGIVSQNIVLFNDTILENIRYSNQNASKEEVIEAAKKAHAYEFISKLPEQFDTVVGERGTRLSGGEKQRIAIARAVLTNPQILILDEATSSLDSESEHYIQMALNELMDGKTSVVIAHRLSTITHANRILVIEDGQINAQGTHEELLEKNAIYKRLYKLQYFR